MRILIVTPAPPGSLKGNRITAMRWAKLLRQSGHKVQVAEQFGNESCDVLIALHARRSARSIRRFAKIHPDKPLVVALTGTDVYQDIHVSDMAKQSLEIATRLVVLQPKAMDELPEKLQAKVDVVYQSVDVGNIKANPRKTSFDVCVLGHLRPVKDPFRAAMAARKLPDDSKIRIVHIGSALSDSMRSRAQREMQRNARYEWLGELPRPKALRRLARSSLLVVSSKMEGGANVISEAAALGVPVVASKISGSIGLLGEEFTGYFSVGDTEALAKLLVRVERESSFRDELIRYGNRLKELITPESERKLLNDLLARFNSGG